MQTVLLAGGLGTRLQEETTTRPKPMVEIGGKPILWHILKHYAHHGFSDFTIALGYMGGFIKRYFLDQYNLSGDLTIDFANKRVEREEFEFDSWNVSLVDTGMHTMTGGRLKRLQSRLRPETFMLTYGDGVSDVDVSELLRFHRSHGRIATMTAVRPPARFGGLVMQGDKITKFTEKPVAGEGWINGGFLVLEPEIFEFLDGDQASLESHGLEAIAAAGELAAFKHDGFWQCMDTLRDKTYLERLWSQDQAPWKTWAPHRDAKTDEVVSMNAKRSRQAA